MSYKLSFLMPKEPITFIDVIKHTNENINLVENNKDDYENIDPLIVNIKNALSVIKDDVKNIDKITLSNYVDSIRHTRFYLNQIINKAIDNVKNHINSLPKDNYDSMSKEELIALLREKQ